MHNLPEIKTVGAEEKSIFEISKSGQTRVRIGKNGKAHIIFRVRQAKSFIHDLKVELVGQGAVCFVSAIFHGRQQDRHDFRVCMHHKSLNTKGDILIRGVYENEASGSFSGLIKIDKKAQLANSFFQDNILLLDRAAAISVPTLEIEANDVKASHGSTTSRIDENQIFYLQTRGVPLPLARRMVIEGFLQPVAVRAPIVNRSRSNRL